MVKKKYCIDEYEVMEAFEDIVQMIVHMMDRVQEYLKYLWGLLVI